MGSHPKFGQAGKFILESGPGRLFTRSDQRRFGGNLGEMLQIASAGLPREGEIQAVAESLARKRHAGREWTQRFVQAYHNKQQDALEAR